MTMFTGANEVIEVFLVTSFFVAFTFYHVYLFWRVKNRPLTTSIGQNIEMRRAWAAMMTANPGKHFTGVQTIRNVIMSASLMASTAVALNTATFVFLVNYDSIPGISDLNVFGTERMKPAYKLLALTLCFLFSFFCYMQSNRMNNHASFQLALTHKECRFVDDEVIADNLSSSANFFTLGTRGYMLAFLIILWLFGPLPPFLGTICLLPLLYSLDISSAQKKFDNSIYLYNI